MRAKEVKRHQIEGRSVLKDGKGNDGRREGIRGDLPALRHEMAITRGCVPWVAFSTCEPHHGQKVLYGLGQFAVPLKSKQEEWSKSWQNYGTANEGSTFFSGTAKLPTTCEETRRTP